MKKRENWVKLLYLYSNHVGKVLLQKGGHVRVRSGAKECCGMSRNDESAKCKVFSHKGLVM